MEDHFDDEAHGLPPWRWVAHGLDVIQGLVLSRRAASVAQDPERQRLAMQHLIGELAKTARSADADLAVFVPMASMEALADVLVQSARDVGARCPSTFPPR